MMDFYAPLSYQQLAFCKKAVRGEMDGNASKFKADLKLLEENIGYDIPLNEVLTPLGFVRHFLPEYVLIRPGGLKHAHRLKQLGVKKIFLDNGVIQRKKKRFPEKAAFEFIDRISPFLDDINYFVVPDNPVWATSTKKARIDRYNLSNEYAEEYLNILSKKGKKKAVFAVHCDIDRDIPEIAPATVPKNLMASYSIFALPFRLKRTFNPRLMELITNFKVDKYMFHILAMNSTQGRFLHSIKYCMSYDTALYNLYAGKFNVMILRGGGTYRIQRILNKQEKMLLSFNNAKFYPDLLEQKMGGLQNNTTLEEFMLT